MTENLRKNPARSVPDWRITMPLAHASPRCGARTRAHTRCKGPAMPNGRCRMHGGASTGPRTPEGLQRIVKARMVHGAYGAEMRELRRLMRALNEERRRVLKLVK
jgi:ribosomal protein L32